MNEAEFTKRLLEMEREVLALKTAHKRAESIASIKVKDATLQMVANQTYLMEITTSESDPPNPLLQVLLPWFESRYGRFAYYADASHPDSPRKFFRKVRWVRNATFTFRVLSSSSIVSITFSEAAQ